TRSLASNKHSSPCAGSETALRSAASRRNIAPKISVPLESPQGSVEFARPPQHSSHLSLAAASACRRKAYREEAVANSAAPRKPQDHSRIRSALPRRGSALIRPLETILSTDRATTPR